MHDHKIVKTIVAVPDNRDIISEKLETFICESKVKNFFLVFGGNWGYLYNEYIKG